MRKLVAAVFLLVVTAACGGQGGAGNITGPSSNPPFNQSMTGTVSAFGTTRHALTIPRSGNMTLRLTWADGAVDLDLILAAANCTEL